MAFPVSKTTTAVGMNKFAMTLDLVIDNEGNQNITWAQGYQFINAEGEPVPELQNKNSVTGQILLTELQNNYPNILMH